MLIAGGLLGEMIDHIQILAQMGGEGQGMGEGVEIIDAFQVAGGNQSGKAIGRGLERVS